MAETFQATLGTDSHNQTNDNDTLIVPTSFEISAADYFNGAGGFDTIQFGSGIASGLTIDVSTAGTDASTGFHSYEQILFFTGTFQIVFNAAQFGPGLISIAVDVVSFDFGTQIIRINNASDFTAANWTFNINGTMFFQIFGTSGNDEIVGSVRPDVIRGGLGNDTIDGGAGSATASYAGKQSQYTFQRVDSATETWLVRDTNAADGNDGTDTLTNVFELFFSNGTPNDQSDNTTFGLFNAIGLLSDTSATENRVTENAAPGTPVGIDANAFDGDPVTYSLANSAGGRFQINPSTGVVTVAKGPVVDFETSPNYVIAVRATSADTSFTIKNFTIAVDNVSPEIRKGTADKDAMTGGSDIDIFSGLGGNDTLKGLGNKDTLTGSAGKDLLFGGAARDVFDFNSKSESVKGGNRDQIKDFNRGQGDKIDLSTIDAKSGGGNQAFKFIGTQQFHDVKGELRCSGGIIQGDINGDGKADFEIKVNLATMQAGDFLL